MKKYKLEIEQDESPESPRSWDNLGTMVCFHKRYNLGDKTDYKSKDYQSWYELKKAIEQNEGEVYILPLYLYDHSGITMSTSSFDCRWDSGQVGFIYVSKDKVIKEYGREMEAEVIEKYLNSEVETYDQYLTGDVWGYVIYEIETCDKGHEHENEIDSCWGFFGHDECEKEGNAVIKYLENKKEIIL
jgi:hypothetical protein